MITDTLKEHSFIIFKVEEFMDCLTLKIKALCEPVAERHAPEDVKPQLYHCGNLKSHMKLVIFCLSLWL
jgi:hypothetical protein